MGEVFHGIEDFALQFVKGGLRSFPHQHLLEARNAEELFGGVHRFGDAVAEEHEGITGIEFQAHGRVLGFGDETDRIRSFREDVLGDSIANQERRRVARVDVLEMALIVDNAEKHRCVAADFSVITEEAIDVIEDASGIRAERHAGQRTLQQVRTESGAESFAGDVGEEKRGAIVAEREDVEVVSADGQAREVDPTDRKMWIITEIFRQKGLLNVAGDTDFLFEALAFAFALNEASVVENAGSVGSKRIENLAIEFREGGRAPRVKIEYPEKIAAFNV